MGIGTCFGNGRKGNSGSAARATAGIVASKNKTDKRRIENTFTLRLKRSFRNSDIRARLFELP